MKSKISTTKPDPDLAKWCAALASPAVTDEVPPGWLRMEEVAAMMGKSESHTTKLLARAAKEGRCETQQFRVLCGQRALPVKHYRLK